MDNSLRHCTDHGARRMQQRAITEQDIERVVRYGRRIHKHHAVRYLFDKATRKRLQREEGERAVAIAGNKLDIFAVLSPAGALITAGYRTVRMKH